MPLLRKEPVNWPSKPKTQRKQKRSKKKLIENGWPEKGLTEKESGPNEKELIAKKKEPLKL